MSGPSEVVLALTSVVIAAVGIGLAAYVYASGRFDWQAMRLRWAGAKRMLQRGFYVNDVYNGVLVAPGQAAAAFLAYVFDARVIDGAVNGLGTLTRRAAAGGRRVQTGLVRTYALAFLAGAVGILWYLAVRF